MSNPVTTRVVTMHPILYDRTRDEVAETGPVVRYEVEGLRADEKAYIHRSGGGNEERWKWVILYWKQGVKIPLHGSYETADEALTAFLVLSR